MNVMPATRVDVGRRAHDPGGRSRRSSSPSREPRPRSRRAVGVDGAVTVIDDRPAVEVAPEPRSSRALWDAHAAVAASPPRLGGVPGTTDGTMLTALGGVPTVVYGPGGKWIAHQADEYVDVADIVEHADVYVEAARRFLGADGAGDDRRGAAAGPHNDLTDVAGIHVGHFQRRGRGWLTGTTVVLPPPGTVGSVDVGVGGAPCTRETDALDPLNLVDRVDAVCLTGGSAYGLASADGVVAWLATRNRGYPVGPEAHQVVPIVSAAAHFDIGVGGRFHNTPDATFGERAAAAARPSKIAQGAVGAGTGAHAERLKGGIGSASVVLPSGSPSLRSSPSTPAATCSTSAAESSSAGPRDRRRVRPCPDAEPKEVAAYGTEPPPMRPLNTTLTVIATDAALTKQECARLAISGRDGVARAVDPVHQLVDGDEQYVVSCPVLRSGWSCWAGSGRAAPSGASRPGSCSRSAA